MFCKVLQRWISGLTNLRSFELAIFKVKITSSKSWVLLKTPFNSSTLIKVTEQYFPMG